MKRLALAVALTLAPIAVVSPVEASKPWLCPKYTAEIKKTFQRKDWRTMDRIMHRESNSEIDPPFNKLSCQCWYRAWF
jgi:hypothetical protein